MKTVNQNSTEQLKQNTADQSVDTRSLGRSARKAKIPEDMQTGIVHETNKHGPIEVVKYNNARSVLVKFTNTGYKATTEAGHIRKGSVRDLYFPSVYGVGFIGDGDYKPKEHKKKSKFYEVWQGMLQRCYDPKMQERRPTYIGCTVCEDWHNFQNFAKWMSDKDYAGNHLDKDILIDGNKIYSPETCIFVSPYQNAEKANAKHYNFISPDGDLIEVYNLNKFCRINNLHQGDMVRVSKSKLNHHKGWTIQ